MKKIFILFIAVFSMFSCSNSTKNNEVNEYKTSYPLRDWLADFEKNDPNWFNEGKYDLFISEINKKINSDIELIKDLSTETEYNESLINYKPYRTKVLADITWGKTSSLNDKNKIGEAKIFWIDTAIELSKPMYNGSYKIHICYEIISSIPSTVQDHSKPYTKNINYVKIMDNHYYNDVIQYTKEATEKGYIFIGTYLIGEKE